MPLIDDDEALAPPSYPHASCALRLRTAYPHASCSQALLASKIVSYAQGFMLMAEAAKVSGPHRKPSASPPRRTHRLRVPPIV